MKPIEIIVIIACVLIVGGVIARSVYKKVKKIPSSECCSCAKKMNRALKSAIKNIDIDED
jgi:hypothetical protein